ncbi:MAG TPA: PQQ-dependent sugar dehydrogenase [Nitrospiria bacterium]|jgi:glucose/arabinose dehydrogenase|nr:PQQ-dependent sugar dehydrogenase [Nitrospiria bacterium]
MKPSRFVLIVAIVVLFGSVLSVPEGRAGFSERPVATGLDFPVAMAFSPDGRLFFTERFSGQVRLIADPTSAHPRLLPGAVYRFGPVSTFFERGLLGLALDPDFQTNGRLYVYYSHRGRNSKTDPYRHRLMRITVKGDRGDAPVALLDRLPIGSDSESGAGNHNGGILVFGPDGKLYLSIGELATPGNSQNLDSFAGKILRLNPDGTAPTDNPFYDPKRPTSPRSYVYALGLRNSFGLTFGPGPPGQARLFATENGPATNDELDLIEPGKNYGWDDDRVSGIRNKPGYVDPILVYRRTIAPTGIVYYTGAGYPERYRGHLFFADWNEGRIRMVTLAGRDSVPAAGGAEDLFRHRGEGVVGLAAGPDGLLYFTTPKGIYRLVYDDAH